MEEWKDVVGYEGSYEVSSYGNVNSLGNSKHGRVGLLNPLMKQGYRYVNLCKGRDIKKIKISVLVAMAFLNHTPCRHVLVVDHINGDRAKDELSNLRVVSSRFNSSAGFRRNASKFTSKYVGVSWRKDSNKWSASICIGTKAKKLGSFKNEIDAHNAYQKELANLTI